MSVMCVWEYKVILNDEHQISNKNIESMIFVSACFTFCTSLFHVISKE